MKYYFKFPFKIPTTKPHQLDQVNKNVSKFVVGM